MSRKRNLIANCKMLVESVTNAENALRDSMHKIHDDGMVQIEQDKKVFRAGFEDRKMKVNQLTIAMATYLNYNNAYIKYSGIERKTPGNCS